MDNNILGYSREEWQPASPLVGPPLPKWMGIYWPWYKEEVEPPTEPAAAIQFSILDAQGKLVPSNSPMELAEGTGPYTLVVSVRNTSTRYGQPYPANLWVNSWAYVADGATIIPEQDQQHSFGAGATVDIARAFSVPDLTAGKRIVLGATVRAPDWTTIIATGEGYVDIIAALVDYGAGIEFVVR